MLLGQVNSSLANAVGIPDGVSAGHHLKSILEFHQDAVLATANEDATALALAGNGPHPETVITGATGPPVPDIGKVSHDRPAIKTFISLFDVPVASLFL